MKKKWIVLTSALMVFALILGGCSSDSGKIKLTDLGFDEAIVAHFADCMSIEEIVKDTETVDLEHMPDFTGLTPEEVINEEDETKDINYKDKDGKIIYTTFEGYGEDSYNWYTESASGKELTVKFVNEGEAIHYVWVSCADYSISFDDLNEKSAYRADNLYVEIRKPNDSELEENLSVECYHGEWNPAGAYFFDEEGYKHCSFSLENEGGKEAWIPDTKLIHTRIEEEPACRSDILTDEALVFDPEFIKGDHMLSYLDEPTGQWYITTEFILAFENEDERDDFAEKYQLEGGKPQGNESEMITLRTGEITVPIAGDSEQFGEILNSFELDTWDYQAVGFNEKGEIDRFYYSGIFEMY